jgi:hypothetical protein
MGSLSQPHFKRQGDSAVRVHDYRTRKLPFLPNRNREHILYAYTVRLGVRVLRGRFIMSDGWCIRILCPRRSDCEDTHNPN